ncbi:adenine deaminase [Peptococcus simiae]|uniref:adenine deaminase n=1 Tax=Peptococcus simiae TaxID=1643805 RepID=UPI003980DF93
MYNNQATKPLSEMTKDLVQVALGQQPADLVIQNCQLVNVLTREILPGMDVAAFGGRIALVGDASACIGQGTEVFQAGGKYLTPGFLDGHIHVESSMMTVGNYARSVVPRGTTGIYMDPHEIANVLGLAGIRMMLADAAGTPLRTMLTVPSCVPAVPGFEDTGAAIDAADVRALMATPQTVGLGEMMNFPGILAGEDNAHAEVAATLAADKVVTGHYSVPDTGSGLNAYIAAGVRCCHESNRAEDALAKMRLGMYAQLREGSAWHDLAEVSRALTERTVDSRLANLISDDTHPHTLVADGHLDHIVRKAVAYGIPILEALQMVTINVATCFRMDHEMGSIAPGKMADMVLFDNLEDLVAERVWIGGQAVAEGGRLTADVAPYRYPDQAYRSIRLDPLTDTSPFRIPSAAEGTTEVRAIRIVPERVFNEEVHLTLPVREGAIEADPDQDVLKAAVFDRHTGSGTVGHGFVQGFGIRRGAMASTVAHDAHNLLVLGASDEDMRLAANTLIKSGGGMCIVADGQVLGHVALPIAGLMCDRPAAAIAQDVAAMEAQWQDLGADMASPFMTMALISLACLPDLRLTNRGLVDCHRFAFVPLETAAEDRSN